MRLIYVIFFIIYSAPSVSQFIDKAFNIENELITNNVYDVYKLSDGEILMCTDQGLTIYDGSYFEHYNLDQGLPDNEIFGAFEDSQKRIWLRTFNGKLGFIKNNQVYNEQNTSWLKNIQLSSYIVEILEYKNQIWFIPFSGDAFVLENKSFTKVKILESSLQRVSSVKKNNEGLYISIIDSVGKDYQILNLTSTKSITRYNHPTGKNFSLDHRSFFISNKEVLIPYRDFTKSHKKTSFFLYDINQNKLSPYDLNVISTELLTNGKRYKQTYFLATSNGIYHFNISPTNQLIKKEVILEGKLTSGFCFDNEGYLWISTLNEGVFRIQYNPIYKQLSKEKVFSVNFDEKYDDFLIGSDNYYLTLKNNKLRRINLKPNDLFSKNITFIKRLNEDATFISCGNSSFVIDGNSEKKIPHLSGVKDVLKINDTLIFGRYSGIEKTTTTEYLDNDKIKVIIPGRANILRLKNNSIIYADNASLNFYHLQTEKTKKITINATQIIIENDTIWCSTKKSGLVKITPTDTTLKCYQEQLPSLNINNIFIQNDSIWMAYNNGYCLLERKNKKITFYNQFNRLPVSRIDQIFATKNNLYLGTNKGLFSAKKSDLKKSHSNFTPNVIIQNFSVNNHIKNDFQNNIKLKHNQNNIRVQFKSVVFSNSNSLRFRYKILQDQKTWNFSYANEINLPNLTPDNYTITIQASTNGIDWGKETTISFSIQPAFYQTIWFWLFLGVLLITLVIVIFYWKAKNIKKREEIKRIISESEQKALRAQMNPHFLFNVLNSIQQFFLKKEFESGHVHISLFANFIRKILNNSDQSHISINQEIETLNEYVTLEKLRLDHNFNFQIKSNPSIETEKVLIPSMIIQPFVENALWHGAKNNTNLEVKLEFEKINDFISVTISDNGKGFDVEKLKNTPKKPKGTQLVFERIKALNQASTKKIEITINSSKIGTIVNLKIPINYENKMPHNR